MGASIKRLIWTNVGLKWAGAVLLLLVPVGLWTVAGGQKVRASAGDKPRVIVQHDYDPISDAVVSWSLKPGESLGQTFTTPKGAVTLRGFRIKVEREGDVPPMEYRIGRVWGGADIASGTLRPEDATPFFERWYGADFAAPRPGAGDTRYYLQLRVGEGNKSGHYEVYGTTSGKVEKGAQPRFWYQKWDEHSTSSKMEAQAATRMPAVLENPANIDYGAQTAKYQGGSAVGSDGAPLASMDLAFQVLGDPSGDQRASEGEGPRVCEERFSFVEEINGPMHEHRVRAADARPGEGEFEVTGDWSLVYSSWSGEVARVAVADFQKFLANGMDVHLKARATTRWGSLGNYPRSIIAVTRQELPEFGGNISRSEGFRVETSPERIVLWGYDERGLMRGVQYLEKLMEFRGGPILRTLKEDREPLFSPRIATIPFYSYSELDAVTDPYTDGLLDRMSHYGFSAIWIKADIDEVGRSSVYPELNNEVDKHQKRLNEIVARAERHGLDVYLYLTYRPLPASFFEKHPGSRGSALNFYGGDNALCTSAPEVQQYMREATHNFMVSVPKLRGTMINLGHEGFWHCYGRYDASNCPCPRCSRRAPEDVLAEIAKTIQEGVKSGRPDADVFIELYGASYSWSKEDKTQSKLIEKLPQGVILQTEFAKEGTVTFGNVSIPAYDFPISYLGPSERFVRQAELTKRRGMPLWAKSEYAIALEFIQTPYIPVFFQWAERFRRFRQFKELSGLFPDWMHYGFMPTMASEVFYWNTWSNPPEPEDLLRRIARRDFGPGTEDHAVAAWRAYSEGIKHYPFSGPMAMGVIQKGPAHPLFFDPEYKPLHNHGRQFSNNLSWTQPWGPELALDELSQMEADWRRGIEGWDKVVAAAPPDQRTNARREGGIARALLFCIRSAINIDRFYSVREQLGKETDVNKAALLLGEMTSIAQAELKNSQDALEVTCSDSRIGYANSGAGNQTGVGRGGIYSPGSIEKKIQQVQRLLDKDIPEYRKSRGLP